MVDSFSDYNGHQSDTIADWFEYFQVFMKFDI